ncbi:bifunctional 2-C-methyl-D-erythritol 4-phosphate cytidylyltransferase/2-C-methyl-D-erythritol 2,4-cyclodiphosphate synthase [Sphingomonas gilva]|uniref:Bifunctional enzyme IspD/IspF n=1 Tax=Sphingomonas gilva TaxID=2305907 RepID=A0A396RJY6_9SPHN|nr:bifunctional 2-C-methyl-D-erythritol 4-phosphate cytidylyltransferase/2-C-methyl-D-erythritol 2,4-cyclodiphosphate synthase [Sphingomonas gilva]RHW16517.1 bifunctional 2-C-methyl-D-erythritol 4-phosphate cytidylyltransferase/2-C-methyl-D-erythritol 2,4-cyclodiphosphate synthase [Sphingomonas gilva]
MSAPPRIAAILVAAGTGTRFGGDVPKQFARLAGKPVIAHAHAALVEHPAIGEVIVVGDPAAIGEVLGDIKIVPGGATRRDSVRAGLDAIEADYVLIHDAARPLLPVPVIDALIAALAEHDGAVPGLPVADTLARSDGALGDVVPRDGLVRVQTPQAFRYDVIRAAHDTWPPDREASDDAQMVRANGGTVTTVPGDALLDKVTFAGDLDRLERMIDSVQVTGFGYDVHRLAAGEELWLGGIRIPHDRGLVGHSDADVVLHAITDAVLGCIGAGDIGSHFPPSEPEWRGASSDRFLEHARGLVEAEGGRIIHTDVTIICEAPRIGPYRDAIRARIAGLLRLAPARVSVKATTTERLGFTGRGEGIAAQAVATVSLPGSI